jgi:endonuclease/exonuclease/phosphatase (EEP) superfamily protein YafD
VARFVAVVNGLLTVLVLAAAVAALLALGGGRSPRLDILAHFALVYGAVGAVGAVWSILAGRGPVVAAAVLAMAASGFLIAPEFNRETPVAAADAHGQVKVIQINALRANADIGRVADWLVAQHPDIVTITEARRDLRDLLIERTGWATAGSHGDLIIFTPKRYVRMDRPRVSPQSQLTFVNATYAHAGGPIEIVTTHLAWPTEAVTRLQQAELASVIARLPRQRMILTGDFNAAPWSFEMRRVDASLGGLTRRDRGLPSFPAQVAGLRWPLPFLPIDHVYAGPGWATVKVERGPWVGSDHYPLVVTLAPVALH